MGVVSSKRVADASVMLLASVAIPAQTALESGGVLAPKARLIGLRPVPMSLWLIGKRFT
jgi:hypothetical protein